MSFTGVLRQRRPHQGHDHSPWRLHLSSRDRGVSARPSRGTGRLGFGVPDKWYREELCAWTRLRDGASLDEEAGRAYCRDRTAYTVPRHVRFVTELPITGALDAPTDV